MKLGELLLKAGVVNELQLQTALAEQQRWGGRLGTILVRMGALTEDLLVKALCKQLNLPRADLSRIHVPASILERINEEVCDRYGVMPLLYDPNSKSLACAVSDPYNVVMLDDLSRRVGLNIVPMLAGETQIRTTVAAFFGDSGAVPVPPSAPNLFGAPQGNGQPVVIAPANPNRELEEIAETSRRQRRALRALTELLVERGVVHHDDVSKLLT